MARNIVKQHYGFCPTGIPNTLAEFTRMANDKELNEALLQYARTIPLSDRVTDEYWLVAQAVAQIAKLEKRKQDFNTVAPNLRPVVAVSLGMPALREVAKDLDASVARLLQLIESIQGEVTTVVLRSTKSGLHQRISTTNAPELSDTRAVMERLSDPEKAATEYNNSHRQRLEAYKTLVERVTDEGGRTLVEAPYSPCIKKIVANFPELVRGWLTTILEVDDSRLLSQIYHLGISLAGHYAAIDGQLSSKAGKAADQLTLA